MTDGEDECRTGPVPARDGQTSTRLVPDRTSAGQRQPDVKIKKSKVVVTTDKSKPPDVSKTIYR